uniref:Uncharacterized protein n=1 Tax=Leptobrachium leishanense TaxID=445787 RepID=A0A8C5PRX7_9ANUR
MKNLLYTLSIIEILKGIQFFFYILSAALSNCRIRVFTLGTKLKNSVPRICSLVLSASTEKIKIIFAKPSAFDALSLKYKTCTHKSRAFAPPPESKKFPVDLSNVPAMSLERKKQKKVYTVYKCINQR